MRKYIAAVALAALAAPVVFGASPASASTGACEGTGGTVPTTTRKLYTVPAGGQTVYVDDENLNSSYGLWIYIESNKVNGLQRGGDQIVFETLYANKVNPTVPRQEERFVGVTNPVTGKPTGITLFTNGFGGGDIGSAAGTKDPCTTDSGIPDNHVF